MVTEDEWGIMKKIFSAEQEISVSLNKKTEDLLSFEPPICDECLTARQRSEEEEQLVYKNVTVYIRRLTSGEKLPEKDPTDPDFDCVNGVSPASKRFRMSNGHCVPINGSPCSDFVRRSNRRQKVRGEREFTVSSDMLLRDLKVKVIMIVLLNLKNFFGVSPASKRFRMSNGHYNLKSADLLMRKVY